MFKKYKFLPAVLAAIYFICGIVLLFNSGAASAVIFKILGILLLISGGVRLADEYSVSKQNAHMSRPVLVRAIIEIVAAIILIFFTGTVLNFISFVVGLALLIACGFMIYQATISTVTGTPGWWAMLALCVAGAIFALLMIFGAINAVSFVLRVAGLALAIYGGHQLWTMYKNGRLL